MEEQNERFNNLLKKYLNKQCTAEEFQEFFDLLAKEGHEEAMHAEMSDNFKTLLPGADVHQVDWDKMYQQVIHSGGKHKIKTLFTRWSTIAASIAIIGGAAAGYWWLNISRAPAEQQLVSAGYDVKAGGDKAVLKLADGTEIELNTEVKGTVAKQGNVAVQQDSSGKIIYQAMEGQAADQNMRNTLTTPAGGKFMLVLPDHSRVWLNSKSSVSYAAAFNGRERSVELTGEAYFEVAKDPQRPFSVKSGRATVNVLGTHFNVSAYPDERLTEVTLCEGAVRLNVGRETMQIRPGQAASFGQNNDTIHMREVDTDEAVDWKNGDFQFDNADIEKVMYKLKRWYNIDIRYAGAKPTVKFTGIISRNNNLSKILSLLERSGGIRFEISDQAVIVKNP